MEEKKYLTEMDKTAFSSLESEDVNKTEERDYGLSKTPEERFAALEILRQRLYGYDGSTARLQRVFEVVTRETS